MVIPGNSHKPPHSILQVGESIKVRGRMPAFVYEVFLKENPVDGSLYYSHLIIMPTNAWRMSAESSDPSWDVVWFEFFVIAHRDVF